jgi:hypothetical protein
MHFWHFSWNTVYLTMSATTAFSKEFKEVGQIKTQWIDRVTLNDIQRETSAWVNKCVCVIACGWKKWCKKKVERILGMSERVFKDARAEKKDPIFVAKTVVSLSLSLSLTTSLPPSLPSLTPSPVSYLLTYFISFFLSFFFSFLFLFLFLFIALSQLLCICCCYFFLLILYNFYLIFKNIFYIFP